MPLVILQGTLNLATMLDTGLRMLIALVSNQPSPTGLDTRELEMLPNAAIALLRELCKFIEITKRHF